MKVVKEKADVIAEGLYTAKLQAIDEGEGKFGAYFRWTFKIIDDDGEYDEKQVTGQSNTRFTVGGKLEKWVGAFGMQAEVGEEIDLDDLIGHKVQIMVGNKVQNDREYSNVVQVLSIRVKKPKPAPVAEDDDTPPARPTPQATKPTAKPTQKITKTEEDNFNFDEKE